MATGPGNCEATASFTLSVGVNSHFVHCSQGLRAPICHVNICWAACETSHTAAKDITFHNCNSASCAKDSCLDFLKAECPPVVHERIQTLYDGACTVVPPSPPRPPRPPPSPPAPPHSPAPLPPPPRLHGFQRKRSEERGWDADCETPTYATCIEATRQYAAVNPGYLHALRVTSSPCEGLEGEERCVTNVQSHDRF